MLHFNKKLYHCEMRIMSRCFNGNLKMIRFILACLVGLKVKEITRARYDTSFPIICITTHSG